MLLVLAVTVSLFLFMAEVSGRKNPNRPSARKARPRPSARNALLDTLNHHAAGIDVGSAELWVAVGPGCVPHDCTPPGSAPPESWRGQVDDDTFSRVRRFGCFTADLKAVAAWLRRCGVTTVAMESTGVYWIPVYDLLQGEGFSVMLVDPRECKRAPGRPKTDKHDCMWIQRLHSLGLLSAAFRPDEPIRVLRSYQRHRQSLIEDASRYIQRMQKALEQMNVKLPEVISDITGQTGMSILKAILAGQRDPKTLAELRDPRCKQDRATIAKALEGTWQVEHLFALKQSLDVYEYYQQKIAECDKAIEEHLKTLALPEKPRQDPTGTTTATTKTKKPRRKRRGNDLHFDARQRLLEMAGVDLTAIEGIEANTALVILSEVGTDMSRWPSEKQFGAWLGLAPNPRKSGGKLLSASTRPGSNRAAKALRLAARSLQRSHSALGAFFRRIASRRGVPKAITATAYKLARIVYAMLKHGSEYVKQGMEEYEQAHKERQLKRLRRLAAEFDMELTPKQPAAEAAPAAEAEQAN
jgi:transposase